MYIFVIYRFTLLFSILIIKTLKPENYNNNRKLLKTIIIGIRIKRYHLEKDRIKSIYFETVESYIFRYIQYKIRNFYVMKKKNSICIILETN